MGKSLFTRGRVYLFLHRIRLDSSTKCPSVKIGFSVVFRRFLDMNHVKAFKGHVCVSKMIDKSSDESKHTFSCHSVNSIECTRGKTFKVTLH